MLCHHCPNEGCAQGCMRPDTLRERMQAEHVEKRAESGTWFVVIVILCFLAAMLVPHWGL